MNNNRGNNRRRGRGNNRPQGGGQQLNRIDSRARGNAPQLLEKYRKLAHDAHLNGDRVTAEYYLQFADHYFRVIADTRLRQDEQRQRRDDRWQDQPDEGDDSGEFAVESDFPAFEQPVYTRREREDRDDAREREPRGERPARQRPPREVERPADQDRAEEAVVPADVAEAADEGARSIYEPPANPFVRDNRGTRGLRPRREDRRPRRSGEDRTSEDRAGEDRAGEDRASEEPAGEEQAGKAGGANEAAAPAGLDSILPPALGTRGEVPVAEVAEAAPAPKRRGRKPKVVAPADGEA